MVLGVAALRHSQNAFTIWRFLSLLVEIQKLNGKVGRDKKRASWSRVAAVLKGIWPVEEILPLIETYRTELNLSLQYNALFLTKYYDPNAFVSLQR